MTKYVALGVDQGGVAFVAQVDLDVKEDDEAPEQVYRRVVEDPGHPVIVMTVSEAAWLAVELTEAAEEVE